MIILNTHERECAVDIPLDRLDKFVVERRVVLEPLDLLRGEVLLFIQFDLAQYAFGRTAHRYHRYDPWWDDPCRGADEVVELLNICFTSADGAFGETGAG